MKSKKISTSILKHLVLIVGASFFIFPLIWMLSTSFKMDSQILKFPPVWIPNPINWNNYPKALRYIPFFLYLKNSVIISSFAALGVAISSSFVAYSFARIKWIGRDIVFLIVLSTIMLPFQVRMIPLFLVFKSYGWLNTFLPLIVPFFFGNPFFIFLLRQFFKTIPKELSDSARVDGCSELRIFWQIILPLAKPALLMVVLFQFIFSWHDLIGPLVYFTDQSMYTLSLGLQQFMSQYGSEYGMLMAAATLVTLPIIVLFFFTQKTFIEGINLSGIKG